MDQLVYYLLGFCSFQRVVNSPTCPISKGIIGFMPLAVR